MIKFKIKFHFSAGSGRYGKIAACAGANAERAHVAVREYEYRLLQQGALGYLPCGDCTAREHACTSVLVWAAGEQPGPENSLLIDPCFTSRGVRDAAAVLDALGIGFLDIGSIFVTHLHLDHVLNFPAGIGSLVALKPFRPGELPALDGLAVTGCPGHSPDAQALHFRSAAGDMVYCCGDAVLDEQSLMAWQPFWPNGYTDAQIVQTWQSVAGIVFAADIVIPGHGDPIRITVPRVRELLANFESACCSEGCPDVPERLQQRLDAL